jgi:DNA-binding NarL/FixJ family response regulator
MIRLLIVDDHTSFRESLAFMLDLVDDITVVAQAGNLETARKQIRERPIDVALLDLDLAGDRGLDLIQSLRMHNPNAVAIVLTGNTGAKSRALAVASGAVGILHKSTSIQDIVTTIRQAFAGEPLISAREAAELMQHGNLYLASNDKGHQALKQLSHREQDVLRALAAGLDNHGIAQRLFVSPETVRSHIVRIYRKLGVDSRLQAVTFAIRHNFLTEDDLD